MSTRRWHEHPTATLPESKGEIRRTLTLTVSVWIETVEDRGIYPAINSTRWVLFNLLCWLWKDCQQLVKIRRRQVVMVFLGKAHNATENNMNPVTADFMRQHVRRYHTTLFSLAGSACDKTCRNVVSGLAKRSARKWVRMDEKSMVAERWSFSRLSLAAPWCALPWLSATIVEPCKPSIQASTLSIEGDQARER